MEHIYLINPAAGRKDASGALKAEIERAYRDSDIRPEIYMTTCVGDATRYVHEWCRLHPDDKVHFYACGGDGTLSEVVRGAAEHQNASVGLVPVGTGNDFMRGFTSPEKFMDMEAQRDGSEVALDLMRCNDSYGINLINTGFDCEVVVKTGEIKRRPWVPGGMAYGMGVAIELIRKPGVEVDISVDGGEFEHRRLLLCAIGNGAYYGGGFMPLPFASLTDGLMDLCVVDNVSRLKFVSLVGSYKKGTHIIPANAKILHYRRCRSVNMRFAKPQNVCMDGEVRQMTECSIEVLPRALHFVLPRGCEVVVHPDFVGMGEKEKELAVK